MKLIKIIPIFLFLFNSFPTYSQILLNDSIHSQLELGIKGFKDRYHSPSVVLVVVSRDSIIFSGSEGFIDMEKKIPATLDSKYQIQSITKMFTATLLMNLVEKGIFKMDDDVRFSVPEFLGLNTNGKPEPVTYFELAAHLSGLPRNSPSEIDFLKKTELFLLKNKNLRSIRASNKEDFLRALSKIKAEFPKYDFLPMDQRHYSNVGYAILGLAIERATKKSYEELVLSNICEPLSLQNTGIGTISTNNNKIATGYKFIEKDKIFVPVPEFYANSTIPASGMYSTGRDLARFICSQFDNKNPVFSNNTIRKMQSLGIGWQRKHPFLMHEGAMLGFRCEIVIHPELEIGWVILTNTTDFEFDRFNNYIASLVIPPFVEKPITDKNSYVGIYKLSGGNDNFEIILKEGELFTNYLGDEFPDSNLKFSGNNSLILTSNQGLELNFQFKSDRKGSIKYLKLNQLLWEKQ